MDDTFADLKDLRQKNPTAIGKCIESVERFVQTKLHECAVRICEDRADLIARDAWCWLQGGVAVDEIQPRSLLEDLSKFSGLLDVAALEK